MKTNGFLIHDITQAHFVHKAIMNNILHIIWGQVSTEKNLGASQYRKKQQIFAFPKRSRSALQKSTADQRLLHGLYNPSSY